MLHLDPIRVPSPKAWLRGLWRWIGHRDAYGRPVPEMAEPSWPPGPAGEPRDEAAREAMARRGRA